MHCGVALSNMWIEEARLLVMWGFFYVTDSKFFLRPFLPRCPSFCLCLRVHLRASPSFSNSLSYPLLLACTCTCSNNVGTVGGHDHNTAGPAEEPETSVFKDQSGPGAQEDESRCACWRGHPASCASSGCVGVHPKLSDALPDPIVSAWSALSTEHGFLGQRLQQW